jgi:hypothetical protein
MTPVQCSTRLRGQKLRKSQVFLSGINGSWKVMRMWKMKEVAIQDLTEPMKMLKKCEIWCTHTTKLVMWKY